jgi:16S rRNA (cytosine1402-N4)-methyltransferase
VYFQALRIEVNNELENLTYFLENVIPNILNKNGRAVIITFHSSEDKIVKNIFAKLSSVDTPKEVPIIKIPSFNLLTKKPITCTESELVMNNRSRSAKLRGVVKNV